MLASAAINRLRGVILVTAGSECGSIGIVLLSRIVLDADNRRSGDRIVGDAAEIGVESQPLVISESARL
jgi:hypothetical protein